MDIDYDSVSTGDTAAMVLSSLPDVMLHLPVSLCHVNADLIRGMGPVFACSGMKRLYLISTGALAFHDLDWSITREGLLSSNDVLVVPPPIRKIVVRDELLAVVCPL